MKKIAVIGAGASGMTAAIAAAREGATVFLFEHKDRVGKKLLLTGNGKCNLTNVNLNASFYHSGSFEKGFIEDTLKSFGCEDTIRFFGELGIYTKNINGRIYPYPETASCVLDALRLELKKLGVKERVGCHVSSIKALNGGFELKISGEREFSERADKVILCCGGRSKSDTGSDGSGYDLAKSLGHLIIKPLPALTGLKSDAGFFKSISGVRADAALKLIIAGRESESSRGELQLTDYGLSGICTFDISGAAISALDKGLKAQVSVDFMSEFNDEQARSYMKHRFMSLKGRNAAEALNGFFHKKLNMLFLKQLGVKENTPAEELGEDFMEGLCRLVKDWRVNITGFMGYDRAQVTSGGVILEEVDHSFESKKVKGLYFAGEILDVDGVCGGYNLQWAFSGGMIAGKSAALSLQC